MFNTTTLNFNPSYKVLSTILQEQEKKFGRRWVLFTDIDRTAYLKGVDNNVLKQRIEKGCWGLVYNTGRHLQGVVDLLQTGRLKKPHAVATNVGTRLYYLKEQAATKPETQLTAQDFAEDEEFISKAQATGFKKEKIHQKGEELIRYSSLYFPEFQLRFQDHETSNTWQTIGTQVDPFKVSFNYFLPFSIKEARKQEFFKYLKEYFKGHCMVRSLNVDVADDTNWCLDIVPFAKDKAIKYLRSKLHMKGVIAGDSGNDLHMLMSEIGEAAKDFLRVCVGGTTEDVLTEIAKLNFNHEVSLWPQSLLSPSEHVFAYIESHDEYLGPISLARAMHKVEEAHTSCFND